MTHAVAEASLLVTATRFCHALRARGLAVSPAEGIEGARVLGVIDMGDRDELYLALRAVLVTRPEDHRVFDELFTAFWSAPQTHGRASAAGANVPPLPLLPRTPAPPPPVSAAAQTLQRWMRATGREDESSARIPRASGRERPGTGDLRAFGDRELHELSRLAARIARRLAMRPSRRWRPGPRGPRVHLRRTVRESLKTGGTPAQLIFRERRPRKAKLVALCDVSGSMDLYARFLLQFLYALQHAFARVETFAFATRLSRITDSLAAPRYRGALDRVAESVRDFSGGTRIGASLDRFEREWTHLVDRRTIVLLLSDGWDTGEPAELSDALARIRRRAARVIWLNPLLGSPDYQPLTRGMQAAMPHVDVLHPAHDLESLAALVRHLSL